MKLKLGLNMPHWMRLLDLLFVNYPKKMSVMDIAKSSGFSGAWVLGLCADLRFYGFIRKVRNKDKRKWDISLSGKGFRIACLIHEVSVVCRSSEIERGVIVEDVYGTD